MRGFTLIEIMVVIVILGVLAALVVPRVLDRPDEARAVAARSDIATIMQALKLYRLDNQRYPTTEQGLNALVAKPEQPPVPPNWKPGGYLERLPKDPWGRPCQYLSPGLKGEVDVFSFGADGQAGGSGVDSGGSQPQAGGQECVLTGSAAHIKNVPPKSAGLSEFHKGGLRPADVPSGGA